jgi:hypothetical protein
LLLQNNFEIMILRIGWERNISTEKIFSGGQNRSSELVSKTATTPSIIKIGRL